MNLIRLSIARPTFLVMITLFFLFLGLLSLRKIPVDLYPDVNYPVVAVRAELSGAGPQEMEELITKRLEDVLSTLAGVKSMRSVSREGTAFVLLEFGIGEDVRYQENQVRAKVATIRRSLPDDASDPIVFRQDPDATPVIEISVTGSRPASELTEIADKMILTPLRQIPGVGEVDMQGERSDEIAIDLNPEALDAWKLNASEVVAAIRRYQGSKPIGKVEGNERTWTIRAQYEATTLYELERIPVGESADGTTIYLRDVAEIKNSFSEVRRVARLNDGETFQPTLIIDVTKQSGENTVAVSDAVQAALETIKKDLPGDIVLGVSRDNAETIRTNVADVLETLIIAAFLTILVVLLFLRSPRSTLTTGLALPSSIITTFLILYLAGFTLNVMTLLSLSLAIGIVVDDAIVVRENIFRHMQMPGKSPKESAYRGTQEVSLAVVATTLTLVAMFLPISTMSSLIGQFFKPFALTVVFAMLVSLWDALTMAPLMSAYYANIPDPAKEWKSFGRLGEKINTFLAAFEHQFDKLADKYKTFLQWSLRRWWFGIVVGVASIALAVVGFVFVKKSFLPTQLGESFRASLDGPIAIPQSKILQSADEADARMRNVKGVDSWTVSSGAGWGGNASINLTIKADEQTAKEAKLLSALRDDVRKALGDIPGYRLRISEPADPLAAGAGGGRFQPISLAITGDDLDVLKNIYEQVREIVDNTEGAIDVSTLTEEGIPEIVFDFDSHMLGRYGISPTTVTDNMKIWVSGDTSNRLRVGDTQIPIRVRLADGNRLNVADINQKQIHMQSGGKSLSIPIANFAETKAVSGPATITRENRQRILRLSAGVAEGAALGSIIDELEEKIAAVPRPLGYDIKFIGQAQQMGELFSEIAVSLSIGTLFVFMVLASLFESILYPFAVIVAIPLAASGAAFSLLATGTSLDLYGGIGMILLAGIVAKNSILLVDLAIQRMRESDKSIIECILETAPLRLRPILMTSAAMVAGMIPIALGIGAAGGTRRSLGIATIGGVVSSTFLSLIVVPSLFYLLAKLKRPKTTSLQSGENKDII